MAVEDVCVLKDSNSLRGEWRMCRDVEVYPGSDNTVRNVKVALPPPGLDGSQSYKKGLEKTEVKRHVSNLIVIVPIEEDAIGQRGE